MALQAYPLGRLLCSLCPGHRFFSTPPPQPDITLQEYQQQLLALGAPSAGRVQEHPPPRGLLSALLQAASVQPAGLERASVGTGRTQGQGGDTAGPPMPQQVPAAVPVSAKAEELHSTSQLVRGDEAGALLKPASGGQGPKALLLNQWQYKHEVTYLLTQLRAVDAQRAEVEARMKHGQAVAKSTHQQLQVGTSPLPFTSVMHAKFVSCGARVAG